MNYSDKFIMKQSKQIDKHLKAIFDICKKLAMQNINLHPQDRKGLVKLLTAIDLYFKYGSEKMRRFCRRCRSPMEIVEDDPDWHRKCWHCKSCEAVYIY